MVRINQFSRLGGGLLNKGENDLSVAFGGFFLFVFFLLFSGSSEIKKKKKTPWKCIYKSTHFQIKSDEMRRVDETTSRLLTSSTHMLWIIVHLEQYAKGHRVLLMFSYEK